MKIKNKGKVHPSPSSSSSSSSSSTSDGVGVVLSVFQLLPAAILALASVLSLEDREVLAYMITRSMKTTPIACSSSSNPQDSKKKSLKKATNSKPTATHQPPMFDCECFDCYRSYWFKWDSSPNRELIHQAIEAFEDHLAHGEKPKKNAGRGKRRDKMGRREAQKSVDITVKDEVLLAENVPEASPVSNAISVSSPEKVEEFQVEEQALEVKVETAEEDMALIVRAAAVSDHKGLARKVLPDVLGLFNSRLWNLWSPNA